MISVALIQDNRLVRQGIVAMLTQTDDFKVIAVCSSCDPALLADARPDVILLDVGLWDDVSLRVTETVTKDHPMAKPIIMDLLPGHAEIVEFVQAGVRGFILKDATFDDLVATIRMVAEGAYVLPPQLTSTVFAQIAKDVVRGRTAGIGDIRMTAREKEVVTLIAEGLSNKEIALRLNIATHTVKSHVRNLMEKLALRTRLQIAAFAHRATSI